MGHLMDTTNPLDPNIRFDLGGGIHFEQIECSELRMVNGPRVVKAEIQVRSRRDGGKLVTARSPSRSYRRAQQGKTEWGFGVITVGTGQRMLAYAGDTSAFVTLTGTVNP